MDTYKEKTPLLSDADIKRILLRLAHQVLEKNTHAEQLVFIGIQTRGVYLAQRLQKIVKELEGIEIPLGILDITLYRDDLTTVSEVPLVKETKIPCDLKNRIVILIDDVLFTGRTIRAALDEIMDFGRPHRIELLVLIDRGHRELPIRADFVGKNIPTAKNELVEIRLKEIDGKDEAVILRKKR
ncbi:MAG: bifunctional pyr operon transcriptional regulator/uracil phosphoribosyltransferase PyrR [Candidatus Omnitrophica bacterium]|nr:bifunctional pyr operon transcriptional regulator/uracil phosphoribosyltransferase PyrR [Candidatus Omnitrophota bacterium]